MVDDAEHATTTMLLGRTDLRVPRLGMGVMVWGDMSDVPRWSPARAAYGPTSTKSEQQEALQTALTAGVNLFDTASAYGRGASERRLGELASGHDDILIATKFPASPFSRAGSLPATLDTSLKRLERKTIDLYQIHYPSRWMSIPTLMNLMADAVDAGKVRAVGVSNYSADQMREAHEELGKRGIPLASNQVQYSLLARKPETNGVLDACRELGVTLIAYMPLASGALTGKYSPSNRPAGVRRYMGFFRGKGMARVLRVNELLREIGERHSKSASQVALRWLIQQNGVLPIPGAKNARQAEANAGALAFELTAQEVDELSQATAEG